MLVRGHDAFTYVAMHSTDVWGTLLNSPKQIPTVLGEGLVIEPFAFPKSQELGNVGAVSVIDQGRQFVRGEFTVYPQYNAQWFWMLIANAMGGMERRIVQEVVNGAAGAWSGITTHLFCPQSYSQTATGSASGIAEGLTMWVAKSGGDSSGKLDYFQGVTVTGFTWNQPEEDRATVTFRIIAKAPTTVTYSSTVSWAAGHNVKVLDFSRTPGATVPSMCKAGATLTDLNIRSFSLTLDGNYEFAPAPAQTPDTVAMPGHVAGWTVTGEITSLIEQSLGDANKPYKEYVDGTASEFRCRYVSENMTGSTPTDVGYAIDIHCPSITWTAAEAVISTGGAPATRFSFEGVRGAASPNAATAQTSPETYNVPLVLQTQVTPTDDGNATFLTDIHGGNDVPAELKS